MAGTGCLIIYPIIYPLFIHYLSIIAAGDWVAQVEFLQSQAFAFIHFHKILLTLGP